MKHYHLVQRTTCTYPDTVTASYGRAMVLPRASSAQRVHHAQVVVDPAARELRTHDDDGGNRVTWFHVSGPHTRLVVAAESLVSVDRPFVSAATLPRLPWDQVVGLVRGVRTTGRPGDGSHPGPGDVLDITAAVLPSRLVPLSEDTQALALDTFIPGQPLADAVAALATRIHRGFGHRPDGPASPLASVLAGRNGTAEDLTHLLLAALRSLGLAALYVAGYLEGAPEVSHAWAAVWFPGAGWVHVDPANGRFIDHRYVVLRRGRDGDDVAPLRGIAYAANGGSTLTSTVEVRPLSVADLARRLAALGDGA